ncbi:hypothetical protein [Chitinophaga deserti]|uniref:hypothetical protein n=1 Tax=Chitinophaga deserti TaxID=2164099 RepID=UPI000D6B8B77|nr:hypothetical protein [Chitinophaga deserti]
MHTHSFIKATFLTAAIPALLTIGACRKETNRTLINGSAVESLTGKPIPYATIILLHARDANDPKFLVWKTTKANAEGKFELSYFNQYNRPLRLQLQSNDSVVHHPPVTLHRSSVDSINLYASRRYPSRLHVIVRKNNLGPLHVFNKNFPKGPADTILTFWGAMHQTYKVQISAYDNILKKFRGQRVPIAFDSVYREPVKVDIPDMELQPVLN